MDNIKRNIHELKVELKSYHNDRSAQMAICARDLHMARTAHKRVNALLRLMDNLPEHTCRAIISDLLEELRSRSSNGK
jgi:hypothetical protein